MVFTLKKRQSNGKLLSQLDDFDQEMIIGDASNERQEIIEVSEGTNDRDFTAGTSKFKRAVNESTVNVTTVVYRQAWQPGGVEDPQVLTEAIAPGIREGSSTPVLIFSRGP